MTPLAPPDPRDPTTIAVVTLAGFLLGVAAYLALHDEPFPYSLCAPSLACPPLASEVPQCSYSPALSPSLYSAPRCRSSRP